MGVAALIRLFTRHRNAANLLMLLAVLLGAWSLDRLNTQFFPEFGIDVITVSIAWPGASPADVDANITTAVIPEVRYLDGVKRVTSYAVEGSGTVVVEFEPGTDMQRALSEADSAIARILTFPEEIEEPVIRRVTLYETISRLAIGGPFPEAALKAYAKQIRDALLDAGIDQVTLFGARDEEIWVEVPEEALQRLDLSLDAVAARIGASSQDLPAGRVEGALQKQIRSLGLAPGAEQVAAIEVKALTGGEKILVRDIAEVAERFDREAAVGRLHGRPAVELHIQRAATADALASARIVKDTLERIRPTLPPSLELQEYDVQVTLIRDRIALLLNNGISGLALVVVVLFLFLNGRTAFWVAAGIPVAMMATFAAMMASGQSINMVSLFALIMTIGIIVDDAIVVGEHADHLRSTGLDPLQAAERGAMRMLAPVTAASLTTIAAFAPLFLVGDVIGQIISAIPMVVIAIMIASLVECFLILPNHLRHAMTGRRQGGDGGAPKPPGRFRQGFDRGFGRLRDRHFRPAVALALRWRYATVATALAALLLCAGLVAGGRVPFVFFPSPESDTIYANILFAPGTPRETVGAMVDELDRALDAAVAGMEGAGDDLVVSAFGKIGVSQGDQFSSVQGDHRGGLHVELQPSDLRDVRTPEVIDAWRQEIVELAGVERIALVERQGGPPGRELDIRLIGAAPEVLKAAAEELKDVLATYPGLRDVEDDLPWGKPELVLELTPRGSALGFTTQSVAQQIRNAFEGRIARRFARGDEEVTIRVQRPVEERHEADLRTLLLEGPDGSPVPLTEVVSIREQAGFDRIRREDARREVAVTGEIDETLTNANAVLAELEAGPLPEIAARHGLTWRLAGKSEEQARTLGDLQTGALVALAVIYIVLAWVFASYTRPLVVMAIIPFGLVGAIVGHALLGMDLTILSLVALLGLSGVLVNDSIVLVTTIDARIAAGEATMEAIANGAADRLRAVLLTSLTTIGGLLPLLFETSLQAQFLIPMAVTLVFGLAIATLLVLVLVPALLGIQEDVAKVLGRRKPAEAGAAGG
ncbi:efflux RND transporter permease subunit [Marinibaculum pumilum]|uniref:Efflux RND transporter permease subunit n=1 Tax=Marinibaculum pumilum TaxID=1766165 RepID=A0ABV7L756_9PROT